MYNPEHQITVLSLHYVPRGDGKDVKLDALRMGLYNLARTLKLTHSTFQERPQDGPLLSTKLGDINCCGSLRGSQ